MLEIDIDTDNKVALFTRINIKGPYYMSDMNQYLSMFVEEAQENLENLNNFLLDLEKSPGSKNTLNEIFRVAHTLKGMAGAMGFEGVKELTHHMEDLFGALKEDKLEQKPEDVDLLFLCLDTLTQDTDAIREGLYNNDVHTDLCEKLSARLKGEAVDTKSTTTKPHATPTPKVAVSENRVPEIIDEIAETFETLSDTSLEPTIDKNNTEPVLADWHSNILATLNLTDEDCLYQLKVNLHDDCLLPGIRAFMAQDEITKHDGQIVAAHPVIDESQLEILDGKNFNWLFFHNALKRQQDKDNLRKVVESIAEVNTVELTTIQEPEPQTVQQQTAVQSNNAPAAQANQEAASGKTVRIPMDRIDYLVNLVGELIISRTRMMQYALTQDSTELMSILQGQSSITNEVQELVMKFRMEPIDKMFSRFPRVIRDLSKTLNKPVELKIIGEDTEVDRVVNEELSGALIHLIRNAIDHGIEPNIEERLQRGKPEKGTIELFAQNLGDSIIIKITDDGRGLVREKILDKALKNQLITSDQVQQMSDKDVNNLIFLPGFSTAAVTTDVSGRGVGMDVVKTTIDKLNGHINIVSQEGQGSSFIITLPTSMAITNVLLIQESSETYALPLACVREVVEEPLSELRMVNNIEMLMVRGEALPVIRMKDIIEGYEAAETQATQNSSTVLAVVFRVNDQDFCLVVDSLIGQQEAVVKPPPQIAANSLYNGVMIQGDGTIVVILTPTSLITLHAENLSRKAQDFQKLATATQSAQSLSTPKMKGLKNA